ncbi:penicillin acylase family protein [Nisaea nitritireducens]|uniref:penicillin acylase family protein n=1 Tax=Nisaea nitritireducens TaxID=568392 RepID=UPI001865CE2F|nr:penicillin acylase family protein [Nisaea nitritireducens]
MLRWGKRLALGLLFVFVGFNFGCAALLVWLSGSVPQIEGDVTLAGLTAPVTVARDDAGVPLIKAGSDGDAYFALGYVHAQDRLWQMESMRRIGAGRIAEIVGNLSASAGQSVLAFDRLTRGLGLYRRAEAAFRQASPEMKLALERYADGVNSYLTTREGALPPEFVVLFHEPEPWKPADSLVWQQLMGFRLGTNWSSELERLRMIEAGLSPAQIAFLYQEPDGRKPDMAPVQQGLLSPADLAAAIRFAAALPAQLAPGGASNAWALAGSRTESGKPLLASDPHLRLTNPNLWYLARIETPDTALAGATVPGVPFLILGHNDSIAWGFTTPHADTQDLFIEQIDPNDPARYLTPDGSQAFEVREERFRIGDREVTETFRSTRHGPVISDIWNDAKRTNRKTVLALSAASFAPGDNSAEGFLLLNQARSVDEAIEALEGFSSPPQNVTLADREGNIALLLAGRVPARNMGDGFMPADGATGAGDWIGWIDRDRLPLIQNPESGMVVQANDRLPRLDPTLSLGREFEVPFRAERIREQLLAISSGATVQSQIDLQMDNLSPDVPRTRALLLDNLKQGNLTDLELEMVERLRRWDGEMRRDRVEPLVYTLWTTLLHRKIFGDELGYLIGDYRRVYPHMFEAVLTDATEWCDDIRSDVVEPCTAPVRESLQEAIARLTAKFGPNPEDWRWGKAHEARFRHQLWSRVPLLDKLLDSQIATDGGDFTVNRGSPSVRISEADFSFYHVHGAGIRTVYDLSDLDASLFSLSLGQSGNPFSEFYHDQAEAWANGRYRRIGASEGQGTKTLTLRPE